MTEGHSRFLTSDGKAVMSSPSCGFGRAAEEKVVYEKGVVNFRQTGDGTSAT